MAVHVFGIRHHGPGSARSLAKALAELRPDCVLVEGPVEANGETHWVTHEQMRPPVALLVYRPDSPLRSVFYPFAAFSPEWVALTYAARNSVPARFMDLPLVNWLALPPEATEAEPGEDPMKELARVAGYTDFERWWERLVEDRGDAAVFPAIHEAMGALREHGGRALSREDELREAAMRQEIRAATKEGFERIAVVCGAWHAPVLIDMPAAKQDAALLKGLDKVKVQVTWTPWSHGRLMRVSGYGAGIESPGWYEHLWSTPHDTSIRWVSKVAQLLRAQDLDASSAQVIDTVRLAETLATLRSRRMVGLDEMNESVRTVLLFGDETPLRLIENKLIVGETLGEVPPDSSAVPVQKDFEATLKRLRLKLELNDKLLDLDLRKDGDRERSHLIHRLTLLGIKWGTQQDGRGKRGTFHEIWTLRWEPEFAVELVGAAQWGNTIEAAAGERVRQAALAATHLHDLTALLEPVLKANLPAVAPGVLDRLSQIAALAPDVGHLLDTLSPLANIIRYGDVRQTDRDTVRHVAVELIARACAGLPVACGSMNDDAAREMVNRIAAAHSAIALLDDEPHRALWLETLRRIADLPGVHGLAGGRCSRLLLNAGSLTIDEAGARASQSLSPGVDPQAGAAWIEGFLEGSGTVLLVNEALWALVDEWVRGLTADNFQNMLPLLRRTFSTFAKPERRQLGERVKSGAGGTASAAQPLTGIDAASAARALPLLTKILGLDQ